MAKTQHRPRREGAKGKELSDVKKENKQLRRQVARLQKSLNKTIEIREEDEKPETLAAANNDPEAFAVECEKCKSTDLSKPFPTPSGMLIVCKSCEHRKMIKKK